MTPAAGDPPTFGARAFVCPHCSVNATHAFVMMNASNEKDKSAFRSVCHHCEGYAYWIDGQLMWPELRLGDEPNAFLPTEATELYEEARSVAARSPRAAAALLRLLVDRLVVELGGQGRNLHDRIGHLVEAKGLSRSVTDAMDAVRLTGNNAVHEGQIDPSGADDAAVVELLFSIINDIASDVVERPAQIESLIGDRARPAP